MARPRSADGHSAARYARHLPLSPWLPSPELWLIERLHSPQNKPKSSPSAADLENGSASEFETELPPPKKARVPRGSRKAALADDPTQPGYGTPVATKWTRNPNAVRHSSRKAAVTKYNDADIQSESDPVPY